MATKWCCFKKPFNGLWNIYYLKFHINCHVWCGPLITDDLWQYPPLQQSTLWQNSINKEEGCGVWSRNSKDWWLTQFNDHTGCRSTGSVFVKVFFTGPYCHIPMGIINFWIVYSDFLKTSTCLTLASIAIYK